MSSERDRPLQRVLDGRYVEVLTDNAAKSLTRSFVESVLVQGQESVRKPQNVPVVSHNGLDAERQGHVHAAFELGLAALNAFLQVNVTGPVLESVHRVEALFREAYEELRVSEGGVADETSAAAADTAGLRRACLASLDVDGVSVYSYIPNIELFCLARWIFTSHLTEKDALPDEAGRYDEDEEQDPAYRLISWLRLRVHVWHYRLLAQPNLGPGSVYNTSSRWTDVPSLQELIERGLDEIEGKISEADSTAVAGRRKQSQLQFLVEKANVAIMLGWDAKAKAALHSASKLNDFVYALSGALGKRTKFQEKSTSQLVVLARSAPDHRDTGAVEPVPDVLSLNDDTLLDRIDFSKQEDGSLGHQAPGLPDALKDLSLSPDKQPQLSPLDQIILLTEATLKDAFSPTDTLTSEEILPYAERVISDGSTNWQIYTQALLVRSRIELHRSRTVERGVLQMQAVADQIIADTTVATATDATDGRQRGGSTADTPTIKVTGPDSMPPVKQQSGQPKNSAPTSFFPAAKPAESSPPQVRLRYIHALSTPPRWHLESELAYAWTGVGSLVSALEIFKRLRLWAEVALCLASSAAADDEGGRGAGGEEKARAVLRWRLFQPVATAAAGSDQKLPRSDGDPDDDGADISDLRAANFTGPERRPPPANAPRLFCILGDVESDPAHYERAWEISNHRYSRAQRSLGEYHLQQRDWEAARAAYQKAVAVNRLSPDMWSRLGDISLRLGAFADAADAFGRAIAAASDSVGGEDARTWSNLGSSLYSLYVETVETERKEGGGRERDGTDIHDENADGSDADENGEDSPSPRRRDGSDTKRDAAALLSRALAAYKRGASIAHDNWRIWDNVVTLASRVRPPVVGDMLLALSNVISIRKTEEALDEDVLRLLLNDAVLSQPRPAAGAALARGSAAKAVCDLLENSVVPLVTKRSELWELVSRERVWRGDLAGAVDAAEKAWRAATGGAGASLGGPSAASAGDDGRDWLVDKQAWQTVVARTDELVSVLENYGPEVASIGPKWKGRARSALRTVMGKGKESWEGDEGWTTLQGLLEGLR